ncbi:sensor histidine kinase [Puerhibacterium sp. TATVAM-FAB25]|uniref:sensor histidine kinase n=1 Tax=Puerhibacterium sp. TATVAM-FAB25 TaxID=3093699 RepID=UPI00397DC2E6
MTGVRGVEVYTRSTLYVVCLLEPFLLLVAAAGMAEDPPAPLVAGALLVLAVLHTALSIATLHLGMAPPPERGRPFRVTVALLGGVAAAFVVLALAAVPSLPPPYDGFWYTEDPRSVVLLTVGMFTLGALTPVLRSRPLVVGSLAVAALTALGRVLAGTPGAVGIAVLTLFITAGSAFSFRLSVWILEVVRELEAARDATARLAVAEERLRIARDVHDVVGRALATVAVKSELAAELARRGDARAVDEILAVRALAQESSREVRGVVAGYRSVDLATELAGARAVLTAAGIAVRVLGTVPPLDPPRQEALAWVVREAVTNVVRHSAAGECVLRLEQADGATVLTVGNDGVRAGTPGPAGPGGNGLAGLRERLAAVGGGITTRYDGDRFVLVARVPAVVVPDRPGVPGPEPHPKERA